MAAEGGLCHTMIGTGMPTVRAGPRARVAQGFIAGEACVMKCESRRGGTVCATFQSAIRLGSGRGVAPNGAFDIYTLPQPWRAGLTSAASSALDCSRHPR